MKTMTKITSLCLATASMLFTPLSADTCGTQECCNLDGCWELGLEFLYWKPCICPFDYAVEEFDATSKTKKNFQSVKPSNHPGWRILAGYAPCDSCLSYLIDWTYVRGADTSEAFLPQGGVLDVFDIGELSTGHGAQGQQRAIYNRINFRAHYLLHCNDCAKLYVYGGFRLLDLNLYRRTLWLSSSETIDYSLRTKAEFSGAGIELGLGGRYDLGCCIGFVSNVGVITSVGRQKYRYERKDNIHPTSINIGIKNHYAAETHCVPGVDLRIGCDYTWACECYTAVFEIGYEVNHYFGAMRTQELSSNGLFTTSCQDFGFAGPYASLRLVY